MLAVHRPVSSGVTVWEILCWVGTRKPVCRRSMFATSPTLKTLEEIRSYR